MCGGGDEGREYLNTLNAGHHRPNIKCWLGSLVLFRGPLDEPYMLVNFQLGVRSPLPPTGSAHDCVPNRQDVHCTEAAFRCVLVSSKWAFFVV